MLARRELSTAQLSDRLRRKGFTDEKIELAIQRLLHEGALDDRRAAVTYAYRAAHVKMRGRLRTIRDLHRIRINREVAQAAIDEVYDALDEEAMLEQALAKRLRGHVENRATFHRLYQYLMRQGFDGSMAIAALNAKATPTAKPDDN